MTLVPRLQSIEFKVCWTSFVKFMSDFVVSSRSLLSSAQEIDTVSWPGLLN